MNRSKATTIGLILTAVILVLSGCASKPSDINPTSAPNVISTDAVNQFSVETAEDAFSSILDERVKALKEKDYDAYMSRIGKNNQFYFNEQERWFTNMIDERISKIKLELLSVELVGEDMAYVDIRQKHFMGENFDFTYSLKFILEDGEWMDYGFNFLESKSDRFIVKYMKDENKLDEFTQMLNDAFDNLDGIYELKPVDDYEMKLFSDQEMLRQRSIPANPWLFTGWSEPDESLKMYTGHPIKYEAYAGVVQHELVHHISIRMCNNNLPVWILEGIAMYDGSAYYGAENSSMLSKIDKDGVYFTIKNLEETNLNTDLTEEEIVRFYNTSYMFVRYICEVYGRDKLIGIFTEAGKKPFHDSTLNPDFEYNNQKTADEVIKKVLGLSKAELSKGYLNWLDELDFDTIWDTEEQFSNNDSNGYLKAMILLGDEFGNAYFSMKGELEELGFEVVTVGASDKKALDSCPNHDNVPLTPDINISEINQDNISQYNVIFIPAGKHHRTLPYTKGVKELLNMCYDNSVYISSMCAGSIVLASVDDLIEGHSIAANAANRSSITAADGKADSSKIVVDGLFITSSESYKSYGDAAVKRLAEKIFDVVMGN